MTCRNPQPMSAHGDRSEHRVFWRNPFHVYSIRRVWTTVVRAVYPKHTPPPWARGSPTPEATACRAEAVMSTGRPADPNRTGEPPASVVGPTPGGRAAGGRRASHEKNRKE